MPHDSDVLFVFVLLLLFLHDYVCCCCLIWLPHVVGDVRICCFRCSVTVLCRFLLLFCCPETDDDVSPILLCGTDHQGSGGTHQPDEEHTGSQKVCRSAQETAGRRVSDFAAFLAAIGGPFLMSTRHVFLLSLSVVLWPHWGCTVFPAGDELHVLSTVFLIDLLEGLRGTC